MNRSRVAWILAAACVLAVSVTVLLDKAGVKDRRTEVGAAVAAAVVALAGGVLRERLTSVLNRNADFGEQLARGIYMPGGRLPLVSQLTDPIAIGLHPAPLRQPTDGQRADRVPAYVSRDIDTALRERLAESGFTVLVGDAAAGKTRTAFEAMRAVLPKHVFIAPSTAQDVSAAAARARKWRKCVLWLDDLQTFLTPGGGITRKDIAELLAGSGHHRVILATMRAIDESRLTGGAEEVGEQLVRVGQTVLEQAQHRVFIERLFSAAEQARAREVAGSDPRLADALSHAGHNGIGEYLARGPQLFNQWEDAWARGSHPRGAALIAAAVDCRRAGFTGPLPGPLLGVLHSTYLERRGGIQLNPEALDLAWEWVLTLRESGSAPLQLVGDDQYDIFDYLVDEFRRREGEVAPEFTARAALGQADPGDAGSIAATARRQGRYGLAEAALRQEYAAVISQASPDDSGTLAIRNNLAVVLQDQGKLLDAERTYRAILAASDGLPAALGGLPATDYVDLLKVRNNLAAVLYAQSRLAEAEAEYRSVLGALAGVAAADSFARLTVRSNLALVLYGQGRLSDAEVEYRAVTVARAAALGDEHPSTLISRNNYAALLMDMGRLDQAEAEFRDLLAIRSRVLGPDHPHTLVSRDNLAALLRRRSGR